MTPRDREYVYMDILSAPGGAACGASRRGGGGVTLTHGELFAGISGFGLGFERAGIETKWAVEIDPQAQRVLRHHHPDALIHDDVVTAGAHNLPPVDIITFGSPCQDLSVAGRRKGFNGERSGLYFEAIRVIAELRPALAIWENVPGAFSSNRGHDFGAALDALADIGALDIAWRVLDAQWFGVAQRRRRVFVVADFGGERAGEILALSESGSRDTPPSRAQGKEVASTLGGGAGSRGWAPDTDRMTFVPLLEVGARTNGDGDRDGDGIGDPGDPMYTLQATKQHGVAMAVRTANTNANGHDASEDGTGRGTPLVPLVTADVTSKWAKGTGGPSGDEAQNLVAFSQKDNGGDAGDVSPTLRAMPHDASHANGGGQVAVALSIRGREGGSTIEPHQHVSPAIRSSQGGGDKPHVLAQMAVRRLTPTECARLQGFPDDWLDLDPPLSDSAQYRMLGNAVCVNVAEFIGRRIVEAAS